MLTLGVSSKKGAFETFGTDIIFCLAHCGVIQPKLSYSQENSLSGRVKNPDIIIILWSWKIHPNGCWNIEGPLKHLLSA